MKLKKLGFGLSTLAALSLSTSLAFSVPATARAAFPGAGWSTRILGVGVRDCLRDAQRFFHEQGFSEILSSSNTAYTSHTHTARAYILCISRPGDGSCRGEGATAALFVAGDDHNEKQRLLRAFKTFNFSVVIDCG